MLALKIGQPSLVPALHSSLGLAASASAAAPSQVQKHQTAIESHGGYTRASQWDPSPPSVQAQTEIKKWWGNRLGAHIKYHTKREKQELATHHVRDRDEVFLDPQPNGANAGDLRLNKLIWWLNNLGVQPSPDQQLFFVHFVNVKGTANAWLSRLQTLTFFLRVRISKRPMRASQKSIVKIGTNHVSEL